MEFILIMTNLPRILLAEDDSSMRFFLAAELNKVGYQVSSVDNGLVAYEKLCESPFSLLIADVVLPEMDGLILAQRALRMDPDLKIIFITGFASVALRNEYINRRSTVFSKPFHLRKLVNEVYKYLPVN